MPSQHPGPRPSRSLRRLAMPAILALGSLAAARPASPPAAAQIAGCQWQTRAELPIGLREGAADVVPAGTDLFLHGGLDRDGSVRDEVYRLGLRGAIPSVERIQTTGARVPRWGHTLTAVPFDQGLRLLAIGGAAEAPDGAGEQRVFSFNPAEARWQLEAVANVPSLLMHAAAYDPVHDLIVIHGGVAELRDGAPAAPRDATFFLRVGADRLENGPRGGPKRQGHSLVYDPEAQRMLLYGGTADNQTGDATLWALDLSKGPDQASWQALDPAGNLPQGRFNHGAAFDPLRRAMVVYGGNRRAGELLMDTWALDLSQHEEGVWTDLQRSHGRLEGQVLAYNPSLQNMLMAGGGRGGEVGDQETARDISSLDCALLPPSPTPRETVVLPSPATPTPSGTPPTPVVGTPSATLNSATPGSPTPGGTVILPSPGTPTSGSPATPTATPVDTAIAPTLGTPPSPGTPPTPGTPPGPGTPPSATSTSSGPATGTPTPTPIGGSPSPSSTTTLPGTELPPVPTTPPPGTPPSPTPDPAGTPPSSTPDPATPPSTTPDPAGTPPSATATAPTPVGGSPSGTPSDPVATTGTPTQGPTRPRDGRAFLPYVESYRPPASRTPAPSPSWTAAPAPVTPVTPTPPPPSATPEPTMPPPSPTALACIVAEREPNDLILEGADQPPLCPDRWGTGALTEGDPGDYWQIVLTRPATLTAELRGIPEGLDYDLLAYTRQGQLIGYSQNPGNQAERLEVSDLAAGDYYLRAYPSAGRSPAPYEIRWATAPPWLAARDAGTAADPGDALRATRARRKAAPSRGPRGEAMAGHTVVQTYKLDRSGTARLFGELEASVMEALWELGQGTVTQVSTRLCAPQQYTTIQTVMNRLVDKGVLERCGRAGGAVVYRPTEAREALIERVSRDLVVSLLADFGQAGVAGLVNALDTASPEQLDALEARLGAGVRRGAAG